ncbi:DNA ligase [Lampropedia puyangensis]|nr:DNA ligase [Lampropedia puyangensis]
MIWAVSQSIDAYAKEVAPVAEEISPTLANAFHPGVALDQYWVSEKYDGIRAIWNGRQLISRQGLVIAAPAWFTAQWPSQPMDGELWAGRGRFEWVQSTVASASPQEMQWKKMRYMVFDMPLHPGLFTARQQALQELVNTINQPWVQWAPQWQVDSHQQLHAQLRRMTAQGAEGLMLRRANAPYRGGRSDDLIKLKTTEDAEAVVVGYVPGKGKYEGMTGALVVAMPSGQTFRIGSGLSDVLRAQPPAIGSVISYKHNGWHASGLPRFARFWRVREGASDVAKAP